MAKFMLVAHQVNSCKAFEQLIIELCKKGLGVEFFHSYGDETKDAKPIELLEAVERCDAVVAGMSGNCQMELVALRHAQTLGKVSALYGDIPGAHRREQFASVREKLSLLFAVSKVDADTTRYEGLYPETCEIIAAGSPEWERYFKVPISREDMRERLMIADDEFVIYVPASDSALEIFPLYAEVINACSDYFGSWNPETKIFLALTRHPADKRVTPTSAYDQIVRAANEISAGKMQCVLLDDVPSSHILSAADLVVTYIGSSVGIEAVARRIPVVEHTSSLTRWKFAQSEKVERSYFARMGAVLETETTESLTRQILKWAHHLEYDVNVLREIQEAALPYREEGESVRIMREALEKKLAERK